MKELLKEARGEEPVDIVFENGKIVDVFNGELVTKSLAVSDGVIIGYGDYEAEKRIDLEGRILAPGFIDGHLHIESSMVGVKEFAKHVLALGTTSVFVDPHEIANVTGEAGIKYILNQAQNLPLDINLMLPSTVPATDFETANAKLDAESLASLLDYEGVFGLGEVMNYPDLIQGAEDTWAKIELMDGYFKDGHAPGLSGKRLNAYRLAGIKADHECTTVEEALEKVRAGMYIMLREASASKDLLNLIQGVERKNLRRFLFATDDRNPNDLLKEGHINFLMSKAYQTGLEASEVIRLGTLNAAEAFDLDDLGAIVPGYRADLVVINSFENWQIDMVFKDGEMVAKEGRVLFETDNQAPRREISNTVTLGEMGKEDFSLPQGNKYRAMELVPDQIVTKEAIVKLKGDHEDELRQNDLVKLAVVERHQATGNIGLGLLKGLGLEAGAVAISIAHDAHNIIAAGLDGADILAAVERLEELQGGLVIIKEGRVTAELALPIAGLMSDQPLAEVDKKLSRLKEKAASLGIKVSNPFMALSFMALAVVPELKLTDQGLIDVREFEEVPLVVE